MKAVRTVLNILLIVICFTMFLLGVLGHRPSDAVQTAAALTASAIALILLFLNKKK